MQLSKKRLGIDTHSRGKFTPNSGGTFTTSLQRRFTVPTFGAIPHKWAVLPTPAINFSAGEIVHAIRPLSRRGTAGCRSFGIENALDSLTAPGALADVQSMPG